MTFGAIFTLFIVIILVSISIGGLISILVDYAKYLWRL